MSCRPPPYRSAIGIPLVAHDTPIGFVYLWHAQPGFYGATDVYPLMTVGTLFAVVLYNHQAYRRSVQELETDELTGFLTRKSFNRQATTAWHDSQHSGPRTVAMIDLDHFKKVNDTYGHSVGDEVLQNMAQVIRAALRADDILGRYGGEEFIVILPRTDVNAAQQTMERIRHSCESIDMCDFTGTITVSIGLACTGADAHPEPLAQVIERADQALYEAKRHGRNQIRGAR